MDIKIYSNLLKFFFTKIDLKIMYFFPVLNTNCLITANKEICYGNIIISHILLIKNK